MSANNGHLLTTAETNPEAFVHRGKHTKVERYGWADPAQRGVLICVSKWQLRIDRDYQRNVNEAKVMDIATNFSWPAFGTLTVAKRSDGSMWIVEGQHRHCAAMRRADVIDVPCNVFEMASRKEEAGTFLTTNSNRKPVGAVEKFKAQLMNDDAAAALVQELIGAVGRHVGDGKDGVRCVRLLYNYAKSEPRLLRKMWTLIHEVCAGECVSERIVDGFMYIEPRMPNGDSLTGTRWRRRAVDIGLTEFLAATTRCSAMYSKGGVKIWAEGIVIRLNKGVPEAKSLVLVDARRSHRDGGDE